MTDKDEFGLRVEADGTTIVGNLSPDAPFGSRIILSQEQMKLLAEIRAARFDEDADGGTIL